LWLNSQLYHGQTETAARFGAFRGSRNPFDEVFNCSCGLFYGGKECGGNFSPSEIGNVLACSSRTKGAMDKRIRQLDSARRIGLETTLTDFLIIVVKLRLLVVEINWAEFLKIGNLEMFLPTVL